MIRKWMHAACFISAILAASQALADPGSADPRISGISTRGQVLTGADVMIAGFIITGSAPKSVLLRGRGPSLGVQGALEDTVLELYQGAALLQANDDWTDSPSATYMIQRGVAPEDPYESAMVLTLQPGAYTAILRGYITTNPDGTTTQATGVGIVEVYEDSTPTSPLAAISTRGQVLTGDSVMIGGFSIDGTVAKTVVIRARGPSLAAAGVPGTLPDPTMTIVRGATVIAANDNWQQDALAPQLQAAGFAPSHPLESALLLTLTPGAYTVIVSGVNQTTGVGIVEVYAQ